MKSSMKNLRICGSSVKIAIGFLALAIALIGCSLGGSGPASPRPGVVVYDAIPGLLPPDMWSVGFQETWTREFGDYIHLAGANRALKSVTVTMSDRALSADYQSMSNVSWEHPITLNIYDAISGATTNTVGSLLGTVTQTFTIPWRPPADINPSIPTRRGGKGAMASGITASHSTSSLILRA